MTSRIFFDPNELKKGNFFAIDLIKTSEGLSYELDEWLGRGGNASVFRCRESSTGNEFAIKFLLNFSKVSKKRFGREIKLLKGLTNDHMTRYHGNGCVQAVQNNKTLRIPFLIMELAERNLNEVINAKSLKLGYEQYAGQFRGLAHALASLHDIAVHRDIKPENILVVGERWLLSDYGLCSLVAPEVEELTQEEQNIGPKFWLSPEAQSKRLGCGDKIGEASDVYQLASVFWFVVTGRHPSGILTSKDWNGPKKLFRLLHRSLFHDYKRRPKNGREFLEQLELVLNV